LDVNLARISFPQKIGLKTVVFRASAGNNEQFTNNRRLPFSSLLTPIFL
jgi:hypothetical protein